MKEPAEACYTLEEVAEICGVTAARVVEWIRTGGLRAERHGAGSLRVPRRNLADFLRSRGLALTGAPGKRHHLRVVVVDDEPMVRAVVANILEAAGGIEVITAADGFEAGKLVADLRPEVVLLDLQMPGIDGATVCRRIKNDPGTAHVRVLFLTGYTDPSNLSIIRSCGADGYIQKPFVAANLIEAVRGLAEEMLSSPASRR